MEKQLQSDYQINFFINKNINFNTLFYFIQYKSKSIGITADAGTNFTSFNYTDYIKLFLQLWSPVAVFQMSSVLPVLRGLSCRQAPNYLSRYQSRP